MRRAPDDIFATKKRNNKSNEKDKEVKQMWISVKEIKEMAESTLDKKDQRKLRQEKLKALGAKGPKVGNIPLKMLQGMRRKQKERELKQRELERMSGMSVPKSKPKRKNSLTKKEYFNILKGNRSGLFNTVGDGKRGFKPSSVGKYSNGVLKLTQEEIDRINNSSKKT